jgi:hypothetical protein
LSTSIFLYPPRYTRVEGVNPWPYMTIALPLSAETVVGMSDCTEACSPSRVNMPLMGSVVDLPFEVSSMRIRYSPGMTISSRPRAAEYTRPMVHEYVGTPKRFEATYPFAVPCLSSKIIFCGRDFVEETAISSVLPITSFSPSRGAIDGVVCSAGFVTGAVVGAGVVEQLWFFIFLLPLA